MELTSAAEEAGLGGVVRVHRRCPRRPEIRLALFGPVILIPLAGVPVFAFWLNHWRFLPGALFVVGCLAAAMVAAPWVRAATRGERYVVAERGVLVWSPRTGKASAVIPWAAVLRASGPRVSWRDAGETRRALTVPPLAGRRDLITAFERRAPVPARARDRIGAIALVTVLTLLVAGPLVWFGAVPTAVELIRGERPEDVFAVSRMCDGGDPFRGAAAYRGPGPHPVAVVQGSVTSHVVGARTRNSAWPPGRVLQLVACSRQIGRARPDAVRSCSYEGISDGSRQAVDLYQGRFEYTVRQTRTGRLVGTVTVDGDPEPECGGIWASSGKGRQSTDVDADPTSAQLDAAFESLVNG